MTLKVEVLCIGGCGKQLQWVKGVISPPTVTMPPTPMCEACKKAGKEVPHGYQPDEWCYRCRTTSHKGSVDIETAPSTLPVMMVSGFPLGRPIHTAADLDELLKMENAKASSVIIPPFEPFDPEPKVSDDWEKLKPYNAKDVEMTAKVMSALPPDAAPARASWDEYFMAIAKVVATRATCNRAHVGALIVKNRRILATGYNGSVRGMPHCDDAGHDLVESIIEGKSKQNCVRTVHAEVNAIAQAAANGAGVEGADLYVTHYPCWPCAKLIFNAGIVRIIYESAYSPDPRVLITAIEIDCDIVGLGETRVEDC